MDKVLREGAFLVVRDEGNELKRAVRIADITAIVRSNRRYGSESEPIIKETKVSLSNGTEVLVKEDVSLVYALVMHNPRRTGGN